MKSRLVIPVDGSLVLVDAVYKQFKSNVGTGLFVWHSTKRTISIVTDDQWATVRCSVEQFPNQPGPLAQDWADVVEFSAESKRGLVISSDGIAMLRVTVPGMVRIRVARRSGKPEEFLIQSWTSGAFEPIETRGNVRAPGFLEPLGAPVAPDIELAGKEAGHRIGCRIPHLVAPYKPVATGLVELEQDLDVGIEAAFHLTWTGATASGDVCINNLTRKAVGGGIWVSYWPSNDGFQSMPGDRGVIGLTYRRLLRYSEAELAFDWLYSADHAEYEPVAILDAPSTLLMGYEAISETQTRLRITHSGFPDEWQADLDSWWRWQLACVPAGYF